jgi:hypothetical protein
MLYAGLLGKTRSAVRREMFMNPDRRAGEFLVPLLYSTVARLYGCSLETNIEVTNSCPR